MQMPAVGPCSPVAAMAAAAALEAVSRGRYGGHPSCSQVGCNSLQGDDSFGGSPSSHPSPPSAEVSTSPADERKLREDQQSDVDQFVNLAWTANYKHNDVVRLRFMGPNMGARVTGRLMALAVAQLMRRGAAEAESGLISGFSISNRVGLEQHPSARRGQALHVEGEKGMEPFSGTLRRMTYEFNHCEMESPRRSAKARLSGTSMTRAKGARTGSRDSIGRNAIIKINNCDRTCPSYQPSAPLVMMPTEHPSAAVVNMVQLQQQHHHHHQQQHHHHQQQQPHMQHSQTRFQQLMLEATMEQSVADTTLAAVGICHQSVDMGGFSGPAGVAVHIAAGQGEEDFLMQALRDFVP